MKLAPESDWMLGEAFSRKAIHHESIQKLWETKWKFPVSFLRLMSAISRLITDDSAPLAFTLSMTASLRISSRSSSISSRYGL